MANSVGYHEAEDALRVETRDDHRALTSMMEELEAVDWYAQRVDAASDAELKQILAHNRDEEKEHSFTFRVLTPEAAVALAYKEKRK